ncbi:MAG: EamA family transporter [Desulfobacterales bacterium]|nr:EamA family transporter [Desulfobacterales bacterium]
MIVGIKWNALPDSYQLGVMMGILTAFLYASFLLSLRKLQAGMEKSSFFYVLMLVSLATAFFLAIEMVRSGNSFKIPSTKSFLALGSLGLFSQVIGWILIANALPQVRASYSGIIVLDPASPYFCLGCSVFSTANNAYKLGRGFACIIGYICCNNRKI